MTTETPAVTNVGAPETTADDIQVVEVENPSKSEVAARTHRSAFGDLFDVFPSIFSHRWPEVFAGASGFQPMKVEEQLDEGTYVIRAEIPGVDPDEGIDLSLDSGRLTISAVREQRTEADEANDFRSEFHYGSFRRSMTLPKGADADMIAATYTDGILEVRVPLNAEEPAGKKIPVERVR